MTSAVRTSPGTEAWALLQELFLLEKRRLTAMAQEHDLAPQQLYALRLLGDPLSMGELAAKLACDSSNVTGITDRLEQRGLVERRGAEYDRRVKLLVLTDEGHALRTTLMERMSEPPELIKRLPAADQRALRDVLKRAADLA